MICATCATLRHRHFQGVADRLLRHCATCATTFIGGAQWWWRKYRVCGRSVR